MYYNTLCSGYVFDKIQIGQCQLATIWLFLSDVYHTTNPFRNTREKKVNSFGLERINLLGVNNIYIHPGEPRWTGIKKNQ